MQYVSLISALAQEKTRHLNKVPSLPYHLLHHIKPDCEAEVSSVSYSPSSVRVNRLTIETLAS